MPIAQMNLLPSRDDEKLRIGRESYSYTDQMKRKVLAAIVIFIWLIIISIFMVLARRIDLEVFFVLWLIGVLVVVELADTRFCIPPYLRYIKYLVAAGIVIFGGIVTQKVLEILAR